MSKPEITTMKELSAAMDALRATLVEADPADKDAGKLGDLLTGFVGLLRDFDDPALAELGRHAWDIIGRRHVLTIIHPAVTSLHVLAVGFAGRIPEGYILVPPGWADMVDADALGQFGAVIYTCSQVVDFYNDVEIDLRRALAYEGHALRLLGASASNDWQRRAMASHSIERYRYDLRPVEGLH